MKMVALLTVLSAPLLAASPAAAQDDYGMTEVVLPPAPDEDAPQEGRAQQMRAFFEATASEALDGGGEAVAYSTRVGADGTMLLSGAMNDAGGVFYVAPLLRPGAAIWTDIADENEPAFGVCRFALSPDALPGDRRFALAARFTRLWPGPSCEPQDTSGDVEAAREGYSVFREYEDAEGGRAAVVALDGEGRFDPDAALNHYLAESGRDLAVEWSMALPIAEWQSAIAELADGTRIYLADPSRSNARICIFEGVEWADFRGFARGTDNPFRTFCNMAVDAHRRAMAVDAPDAPEASKAEASLDPDEGAERESRLDALDPEGLEDPEPEGGDTGEP
ncbi:hypothetical protein [Aurantiacibacter aquimixticola]|uniref:Uncharacterized protein n=1 Tax=Aurantiacibacter aquimixticola TaxID=1958945 RepID=A0A419RTC9_9SPHN|nr:hypothetical protein [Aurantiacibacter aquimixticola]RJY09028.1 hypothetical protein D6201_06315 [Aurantiacibacter aquimixticola]